MMTPRLILFRIELPYLLKGLTMNVYFSNHGIDHKSNGFITPLFTVGSALTLMGILIVMFPMILAVIVILALVEGSIRLRQWFEGLHLYG